MLTADDGLFLREAVRICPEGSACGVCRDPASLERLAYSFSDVEDLCKPTVTVCADAASVAGAALEAAGHRNFDLVVAAGFLSAYGDRDASMRGVRACSGSLRGDGAPPRFVFAERAPQAGILPAAAEPHLDPATLRAFREADSSFFSDGKAPGFGPEALAAAITSAGLSVETATTYRSDASRALGDREAEAWMSQESPYGAAVVSALGPDAAATVKDALKKAFALGSVAWPSAWSIATAS